MKLYNTLTRKKEEFIPIVPGKVGMYNCGPTVYNYIHVGNARPLVVFDTLRRYFIYKGMDVKYVFNFTDVDDKIINKANSEGVSSEEISERYIAAFKEDAAGLGIYAHDTLNPKATEYISEMIDFIKGLEEKGAAYNVDGNVYFRVNKAKDYGKLSKKNIEDLRAGARIEISEEKEDPLDFALWKKKKEGEPYWESPWGDGRPGWHIECSVMSQSLLGDTIDIHSGGEDLQFPHHENEIAQSETLHEKTFANYWLHNGMITVDNRKMSKSLDNFFLVRDVVEHYDYEVLRFFLLSVQYRSPINYSRESMDASKAGLERMYNCKHYLERLLENASLDGELTLFDKLEDFRRDFEAAMDDDLNTADAISVVFELVRFVNTELDENSRKEDLSAAYQLLLKLTDCLGLLGKKEEAASEEIEALIAQRNEARAAKDFAKADEIRDRLKEMGIVIEDTRQGVIWKRV